MSKTFDRTTVAVQFLDPSFTVTSFAEEQPVTAITEPLTFSMLDGLNEEGTWEASFRLDDFGAVAGFVPTPTGAVQPGAVTTRFVWDFTGTPPEDPTTVFVLGSAEPVGTSNADSFTVSSLGYTFDPVATVTASPSGVSFVDFTFTLPKDQSPAQAFFRIGRISATPTRYFITSSTSGHTRKLPLFSDPSLQFSLFGSPEPVAQERPTASRHWVSLVDVPRTDEPITLRVHVVGTDPTTQGIDIGKFAVMSGVFPPPVIGQPVRIVIGDTRPDYPATLPVRDDVFYGVVESFVYEGVTPNSLVPIIRMRGRGILSLLEGMVVAPPPDEPRATERVFVSQTPGQIWSTLRTEGIARGLPSWIGPTFTTTQDSRGNSWSPVTLSVQVGATMLDVLKSFAELGYEFKQRRGALELFEGEAGEGSESAPVQVLDQQDQNVQEEFGPVRTAVLYREPSGELGEVTSFVGMNASGRRETYVEAQRVGGLLLAQSALNRLGFSRLRLSVSYPYVHRVPFEYEDAPPDLFVSLVPLPYVDYELGDWVKVEGLFFLGGPLTRRVTSVALTMNDRGELRIVPEFGDIADTFDKKTAKLLAKLDGGTGDGAAVQFRDIVGSPASLAPVLNVTGATGVQGVLSGSTIRTVDTVASYDVSTNLIQTTSGLTVANYTGGSVSPSDGIYIVNGEAAVGKLP